MIEIQKKRNKAIGCYPPYHQQKEKGKTHSLSFSFTGLFF